MSTYEDYEIGKIYALGDSWEERRGTTIVVLEKIMLHEDELLLTDGRILISHKYKVLLESGIIDMLFLRSHKWKKVCP
jgi:hypothetical protein